MNNTIIFILSALLMLAVPLLLLGLNFFRQHRYQHDTTRRQKNINAAKQRLATAGSSGNIAVPDDDLRAYEDEIKAQLLADNAAVATAPDDTAASQWRLGGIVCAVVFLLAAPLVYMLYGTPQLINPAAVSQTATNSPDDIAAFITQLEQRLADNPQDGEVLTLLGAAMMIKHDYQQAADYYARARAIDGDSRELLLAHVEALMSAGTDKVQTEEVLQQALSRFPDDPFILWLAGRWALENGDSEKALSYWYSVQAMVSDDEIINEINNAIAQVEQSLNTTTDTATAATTLLVKVRLSDSSKQQVDDNDTVFVYASAAEGSPMPLAIWRGRAADLPADITLSDSMAMTPQHTLSKYSSYRVIARVSKSGDAKAASGDLFGNIDASQNETVTVIINQQVP